MPERTQFEERFPRRRTGFAGKPIAFVSSPVVAPVRICYPASVSARRLIHFYVAEAPVADERVQRRHGVLSKVVVPFQVNFAMLRKIPKPAARLRGLHLEIDRAAPVVIPGERLSFLLP